MKTSSENPDSNILGNGLNESDIAQAVRASGYPLQIIVSKILSKKFYLIEEWSYLDNDTERTIDLLAEIRLFEFSEPQPRVRPTLNLLIECKQSDLPYIFFISPGKPYVPKFPNITGLSSENVVITSDDDPSSWNYSALQALGLHLHPFLSEQPKFCMTFSKCARKGKNIELSGSAPFQGLVFPLLKAVSHFKEVEKPPETAWYFDAHLALGLAVLDAPMVGVRVTEDGNELELIPWARVVRHQSTESSAWSQRASSNAIDVVHADYLAQYIQGKLMPFAEEFSKLALKHQHVLAEGRGFVSGMGQESRTNIEPRLQKAKFKDTAKRYKAIGNNIMKFLKGKKANHT